MPCVIHKLQLVVKLFEADPDLKAILKKVTKITGSITHSNAAQEMLAKLQDRGVCKLN